MDSQIEDALQERELLNSVNFSSTENVFEPNISENHEGKPKIILGTNFSV